MIKKLRNCWRLSLDWVRINQAEPSRSDGEGRALPLRSNKMNRLGDQLRQQGRLFVAAAGTIGR